MKDLNETLKTYMEKVVSTVPPKDSQSLIGAQDERLAERRLFRAASSNALVQALGRLGSPPEDPVGAIIRTATYGEAVPRLLDCEFSYSSITKLEGWFASAPHEILSDMNDVRVFDLPRFEPEDDEIASAQQLIATQRIE